MSARSWRVIERHGELFRADPYAPSHGDAFDVVALHEVVAFVEALKGDAYKAYDVADFIKDEFSEGEQTFGNSTPENEGRDAT